MFLNTNKMYIVKYLYLNSSAPHVRSLFVRCGFCFQKKIKGSQFEQYPFECVSGFRAQRGKTFLKQNPRIVTQVGFTGPRPICYDSAMRT